MKRKGNQPKDDIDNSISRLYKKPLSRDLEIAVRDLVQKGCERERLLLLLASVFRNHHRKPQIVAKEFLGKKWRQELKARQERIRQVAIDIKDLQRIDPLDPLFLRVFFMKASDETLAAISIYERLPELLRHFADIFPDEVLAATELLSKHGCKWSLLSYVETATRSPRYEMVSSMFDHAAALVGLDNDDLISEFSAPALQKFYKTDHKALPTKTLRKLTEFLQFLVVKNG